MPTSFLRSGKDPAITPPATARQYWEERHAAHPGRLRAVGHRLLSEAENLEQYRVKQQHLVDAIKRFLPESQGKQALDAGCGWGAYIPVLVGMGFEVVGVDFSATAIESARRQIRGVEFIVSALSSLQVKRQFDVITVLDVLLHIVSDDEWRETLGSLRGHLRPGGLLVILDCLNLPDQVGSHCRRREIGDYHAEFRRLGMVVLMHDQFELVHEQSMKDLLVCRRVDRPVDNPSPAA